MSGKTLPPVMPTLAPVIPEAEPQARLSGTASDQPCYEPGGPGSERRSPSMRSIAAP
jgi:hypothetical protein